MSDYELITYDIHEPRPRYKGRKGIYPIIEDYDLLFKHLDVKPVLANDIDLETPQGKARFNELVFSRHSGDVFSNVPACICRKTTGGSRVKEICVHCGFAVLPITEQPIEPIVWVKAPDGIPAFMNLTVYRVLRLRFMKSGFSTIDYLLDPKYQPPKTDSKEEAIVKFLVPTRGMTYFHDNFDEIMEKLSASRHFLTAAKGASTKRFLDIHRHIVFCQYLPFPSKIGFIIEDVGETQYVDPKMAPALSALINLANVTSAKKISRMNLEVRVARSHLKLLQYYSSTEKTKIFDKKGVLRKLAYGMSPHFTFRTVITSNHKPHDHETLELPWGASVLTFKLHIAAKLRAMKKFTPNEILSLIYDNTLRTHSTIEKIFDELIAESPGGRGIPCTFTRFPSLKRGSTQFFYISHIKRDPTQLSTSISVLTLKAPNADFDGDYMSGQLALDNVTARALSRMAPYTGFMDFKAAFRVSDHAAIPAPVLSTINNRLAEGDALSVPMG
jgi:hypothetical protein